MRTIIQCRRPPPRSRVASNVLVERAAIDTILDTTAFYFGPNFRTIPPAFPKRRTMHPRPYRLLLRSLAAFLLLLAAGFAQPASAPASNGRTSTVEMNVDRPGNDYKDFDLKVSNAQLCKKECLADSGCHAWTYVRPNTTRGPNPR